MRSSVLVAVSLVAIGCNSWSVRSSPPKQGSLDKAEIRSIIRSHLDEVRYCWERRLDQGAVAQNRVVLELRIVAGGGVDRARVVGAAEPDEGLERCFVDHALGWRFPPPSNNGTVIVTYPFALRSD